VTPTDRLFFAFSFGPFIGFWLAFEAATKSGCRVFAGGGMTSVTRLRSLLDQGATVLCCTPTYALHLAEIAAEQNIDLSTSPVRLLIVAGEPGGSLPATRSRLEAAWPGARVFDHHGMTETGPVTFECPSRPGVLHVLESSYIAEIVEPGTNRALPTGETGELVLTTLGRVGSPLLRYRTGDLVRACHDTVCECGRSDLALDGGILGRTDDMVVIRGVNVYPSALDEVVRSQEGIAEYQVRVDRHTTLSELSVQVEPLAAVADAHALAARLEAAFQTAFNLRVPVGIVAPGTLPRFEMKAKRWQVQA
jgi:phenylacetate-CoA ligase